MVCEGGIPACRMAGCADMHGRRMDHGGVDRDINGDSRYSAAPLLALNRFLLVVGALAAFAPPALFVCSAL